ncbi:HAD-IA family hydrolase [Microvirga guangxiensis]|uniref:Sugar-phosphatase n=1 Tax=Microvirga guangxiensis TaxID=549386 RepID=A0A1G5L2K8_9HYPH|nr:HAD-IA family hydrolase [Microvirga guangxiensis]SCZ06429.1 sugar-phosphatase [Microvirga guangxiensis]
MSQLRFHDQSYAAFLFDMDGTLLDSTAVIEQIWRTWAARHGIDHIPLLAAAHGVRLEDTIRQFGPAGINIDAEAELLLQEEMDNVDGIVPIDGIGPLLASLDPASWAIVTSASRELAHVRLRAIGLPLPAVMICAEDVARGKPDPEGYLKAADLLGVSIDECLVFEDAPAGVAAAKAAGAHVAIVGDRVPASEGTHVLRDYREIMLA